MKTEHFKKIIGYDGVKAELERVIDILNNKEKYQKLNVNKPDGICLVGKPGLGKTLFSYEFMNALKNRKQFILRKTKDDGAFLKEIQKTFKEANECAPSVILFDDLDKFSNTDNNHKDAPEYVCIQSNIDKYKNSDIYIIATVNDEYKMPDSLKRAGRLKVFYINKPNREDSIKIIEHYLKDKNVSDSVDLKEIANIFSDLSCAEIENIINEAGIYACFSDRESISFDDLITAFLKINYKSIEVENYDNIRKLERISVHESGHALIQEILDEGSVNLVSVRSISNRIVGITLSNESPNIMFDIEKIENKLIGFLGGAAAVEVIFGVKDSLAEYDYDRAKDLLNIIYDDYYKGGFLEYDRAQIVKYTNLENYYQKAKNIICNNIELLLKFKDALMDKKILTGKDIKLIRSKI